MAFVNDTVWGICFFVAIVTLSHPLTFLTVLMLWAGAGNLAAILGAFQDASIPKPNRAMHWFAAHQDLLPIYLVEFLILNGATQGAFFGIAWIAGLAELGAIRAAQLLLGPLNVLFFGISLTMIPEGVRLFERSPNALRQAALSVSLSLATAAAVWGLMVGFMPREIGRAILSHSLGAARTVLLPMTLAMICAGIAAGAASAVRSMGARSHALRARGIAGISMLAAGMLGAALAGERGAAWGLAFAFTIAAIAWWKQFGSLLKLHDTTMTLSTQTQER